MIKTINNCMNQQSERPRPVLRHAGPPLLPVALVHVILFIAAVLAVTAFVGGDRYPRPFEPIELAQRFFARHSDQARVGGFLAFASAFPLGIFAATVVSRLRFLGVRAAGELIALFGGLGSACMSIVSGACSWALSTVAGLPGAEAAVGVLQQLGFASGGPAAVALFGLFVAGVSVTSGVMHLLPRWLVWFGLCIALAGELSTLALVVPAAVWLLPLARFGGFAWLIAVAIMLPAARGRRTAALTATEQAAG
jgi:hypothetical protein